MDYITLVVTWILNIAGLVGLGFSLRTWWLVRRQLQLAGRLIPVHVEAVGRPRRRVVESPAAGLTRGEVLGLLGMTPAKGQKRWELVLPTGGLKRVQEQLAAIARGEIDEIVVPITPACYDEANFGPDAIGGVPVTVPGPTTDS